MADENDVTIATDEVDEIDAIGQLKQELATLKANTVSKEQYNKLKKAYVEGGSLSADEHEPSLDEKKKDFKETVTRIANGEASSNLEHAQDLLHFRDLSIELYGKDPFLPSAGDLSQDDIEAYHRAAELYEYAVETADGDTAVFNSAFGSKIKDVPSAIKTQRR